MTTPMCEDGGPLREWAPLAMLFQQIPVKAQNGLFTQDINFTCIDVVTEFIAVGTNHGLVYWYGREKGDIQRLRCENTNANITCVRVISTVDYMVAAGNDQGIVTVFQIPKNPPDSLPDSLKPKQKKQVERYNIGGLHKSAVTTVEWSKNGMKLFSGDQDGLVVLTEIDFYMHLSKSSELLNEKYSVVQLSYQQGLLLVSTLFRTILVNRNQNDKVSQVGQKERKTLGKLGATFGPRQSLVQEPVVYASRPGLRLWQADKNGTVLKTLIFKDAFQSGYTEVELLNPAPENTKKSRGEPTFGVVLSFCDDLLVTYSDDVIYVVNPANIAISSAVTDLRRVTDVACNKDEIFILEGDRNIIRIAYHPDTRSFASGMENTVDPIASIAVISKPVTAGILELTSKLKESAIVPAIPFHKINPSNLIQSISALPTVTIGTDTTTIVNAEEAIEVPPIIPLNLNTSLSTEINAIPEHGIEIIKRKKNVDEEKWNDRRHIFQKIGEQEFEDVVFTPERKSKKILNRTLNGNENDSPFSDSDDSLAGFNKLSKLIANNNETKTTHSSLLTLSIDDDFILRPERRSLETIQKDVENKEKLLAGVLNFDLSEYMTGNRIYSADSPNSINTITYVDCNINSQESLNGMVNGDFIEQNEQSEHTETDSIDDEDESYRTELKKLEDLTECRKQLLRSKLNQAGIPDACSGDSGIEGRNSVDLGFEPSLGKIQINVLSREPMAANVEEDEWVLL